MKNPIPTITIGIPAHNEQASIGSIVTFALAQIQSGYRLLEIIIYCDACTDKTVDIARRLAKKHKAVTVYASRRRKGKGAVLNEIFRLSRGDVLVLLDADVKPAHLLMLSRLVRPFQNGNVGIVSGNDQPYPEKNLFVRIASASYELWYETRKNINGGDSVHNVHGPVYALRKSVYVACTIPEFIDADDHYAYITAKSMGYTHVFAKNAQVYFKSPDTLSDYLMQHSRYLRATDLIVRHFGAGVMSYYEVPRSAKVRAFGVLLRRKPIMLVLGVALQVLLRFLKHRYVQKRDTGRWKPVESTKNILWRATYAG